MYNCAKIWPIWRIFNFSTKFSLKHVRRRFKINGTREWLSFSKKSLIWLFRWFQSLLGDFQMLSANLRMVSAGFRWFQYVWNSSYETLCLKFLLEIPQKSLLHIIKIILKTWCLRLTSSPDLPSVIASQALQHDKHIKIDNKSIYFSEMSGKGLNCVEHLFNESQNLKTWNELKTGLQFSWK